MVWLPMRQLSTRDQNKTQKLSTQLWKMFGKANLHNNLAVWSALSIPSHCWGRIKYTYYNKEVYYDFLLDNYPLDGDGTNVMTLYGIQQWQNLYLKVLSYINAPFLSCLDKIET